MNPSFRSLAIALTCFVGLTACSQAQSDSETTTTEVVAGFYPLAYIAEQVAGEDASVTSLATPGQEPHDLELSLTQTAAIAEADLALIIHGFQPAVDDALEQSEAMVLSADKTLPLRKVDAEDEHQGEEDEHESESATSEEEHAEESLGLDPHFWLDPNLVADYGSDVASALSELDPENAANYKERATELQQKLEQLDSEYAESLAGCEIKTVVVSHNAFAYLESYGLRFEAIAGLSPTEEPSPDGLASLAKLIREEGITTVFTETLASPDLSETLARDTGVGTAVLDPIEGISDETAGSDYFTLMRDNLTALTQANSC
jgi:zinc transport system substrate-binding protein